MGFCTAEFWASLANESAVQKNQTLPDLGLLTSSNHHHHHHKLRPRSDSVKIRLSSPMRQPRDGCSTHLVTCTITGNGLSFCTLKVGTSDAKRQPDTVITYQMKSHTGLPNKVCPRLRDSACWRSGEITQPRTSLIREPCKTHQTTHMDIELIDMILGLLDLEDSQLNTLCLI